MRTALITTTINVPTVLALYRKYGPGIPFFIAGDHKTPREAYEFCADLGDCTLYSPEHQVALGYKSSELIGWNTDSRRNIALLEALKAGAEIIISIDDDMMPYGRDFFPDFTRRFYNLFSGLQLGEEQHWTDAGQFTIPPARQRGLPLIEIGGNKFSFVNDVQIGVVQGTILGVPDTDAVTAISEAPLVTSATDILKNGFVIHPDANAVFNSQIMCFRRELAPAFAQFYRWHGRNTDIFASLIMRRIMRDQNLYTYFGPPAGFHARTWRPPSNDLKAEMFGLEWIEALARFLDACILPHKSVLENLRLLWRALGEPGMLQPESAEAALAFLDDCESVL